MQTNSCDVLLKLQGISELYLSQHCEKVTALPSTYQHMSYLQPRLNTDYGKTDAEDGIHKKSPFTLVQIHECYLRC